MELLSDTINSGSPCISAAAAESESHIGTQLDQIYIDQKPIHTELVPPNETKIYVLGFNTKPVDANAATRETKMQNVASFLANLCT